MAFGDRTIYTQHRGKMVKIAEPTDASKANFLIVWRRMDWSGFRTLAECIEQFPELQNKPKAMDDDFSVVERL